MENVKPRVRRRVERDFGTSASEVMRQLELLKSSDARGTERVHAAAVLYAEGDWSRFSRAVELARTDWRDLLVGAGIGDDDWESVMEREFGSDSSQVG